MKHATVILAHPYPQSFNHAIFQTVIDALKETGVDTYSHDLYAEEFNPVLTRGELGKEASKDPQVFQYSKELVESDYLIFIHPNWWGQPPAILKGYIDRVIRPPHAYDFPADASGGGIPIGKLVGKYGIVYNISNTPADRENNFFGDPLQDIWEKCGDLEVEESAAFFRLWGYYSYG